MISKTTENRSSVSAVKQRCVFGLAFDPLDLRQAVETLAQRAPNAPFAFVVTPNVDHVVRLHDRADPGRHRFIRAYRLARWRFCDSRVLALLALLKNKRLPVAPGSDLTAALFADAVRPGDVISVVGSAPETIATLRDSHPAVVIRHHQPPMGLCDRADAILECAEFIERCGARFAFIAVGSPQQEMVAATVLERGVATGTGLCIGTALDFLSGQVARAPVVMRRIGLEWLHRLTCDPKRLWRRYLISGPRIFKIALRFDRPSRHILD